MKVLSIKQPWASLIAHGIKDIENRTWKTKFRGRILIHVSAPTKFKVDFTDDQAKLAIPVIKMAIEGTMPFGAIIGEVDIVDCVINHPSFWADKSNNYTIHNPKGVPAFYGRKENHPIYNWVLANPVSYDTPILNIKGKLSFWDYGFSEHFNSPVTKPINFK